MSAKRKCLTKWFFLAPATLAVVFGLASSQAQAGNVIVFDPTGGGGANGNATINATQFTYAPGNALAIGAITPGVGPVVGTTFELKYQAILGGISGTTQIGNLGVSVVSQVTDTTPVNGGNIQAGAVNTGREVTIVADFREVITGMTVQGGNNVFTFALAPGGPNNVSIYSAPAGTAKNLAGTGFNTGTLILSGTVVPSSSEGTYTSSIAIPNTGPGSPSSPVLFDQYAGDYPGGVVTANGAGGPYPGIFTLSGSGSTFLPVAVNFTNPLYFPGLGTPSLLNINFPSISAAVPFNSVSPSMNFTGTIPNIGTVNQLNGRDAQFQAQAANDFVAAIPEPSSVISALTAAVLIPGFVFASRRRQNKAIAA